MSPCGAQAQVMFESKQIVQDLVADVTSLLMVPALTSLPRPASEGVRVEGPPPNLRPGQDGASILQHRVP